MNGSNGTGKSTAGGAADSVMAASDQAKDSRSLRVLVTVGLIAYGVVHLLVGWIVLQLAWGGGGQEADQRGAMSELASTSLGRISLWVVAVGLFALVLWQGFQAVSGYRDINDKGKRIRKRLGSAGKVLVYAALGISAGQAALNGRSSGGNGEETLTARLLSATLGRILVIAVALAIVAVGGRLVYRGVKKKFVDELTGPVSPAAVRLGQLGFSAKGIVLILVGLLFGLAAATYDSEKAGGMDEALRTLKDQPFGPVLLTVIALGLACFGIYCFFWSRQARH